MENKMPAVALTDHGVMFGAIEFYKKATKAGIKPIIGVEAYIVTKGSCRDKDTQRLLERKFSRRLQAMHGAVAE